VFPTFVRHIMLRRRRAVAVLQDILHFLFQLSPSRSNHTQRMSHDFPAPLNFTPACRTFIDYITHPSPFAIHAHYFQCGTPLHDLPAVLTVPGLSLIRNPSELASVGRLAALFWIHSIFLEHSKSPTRLSRELKDLQLRLLKHHSTA
jgi:hypothetical protein